MGRFLLVTLATMAILASVGIVDGGTWGSTIGDVVDRWSNNTIAPPIARFVLAFALLITGILTLGLLLWRDRSPREAYKRRNLIRALINLGWFSTILATLGAVVIYLEMWDLTRSTVAQIVFSGFLSGAVGFGELIQRYRDDPQRLMASAPTAIYVCVNTAAGVGALTLVKHFDVFSAGPNKTLYEVLLAGFSAIAFFRTSFFTAKVGDVDVGIGPATLLKSLLDSSERMTDREQAVARGETVAAVMTKIDFDKAKAALPTLCFTLIENSSTEQQAAVAQQVLKLNADTTMSADAKAIILGVYLLRQVGALVLAQAIETLGEEIAKKPSEYTAKGASPGNPVDQSRFALGNDVGVPDPQLTGIQGSVRGFFESKWEAATSSWHAKASSFKGTPQARPEAELKRPDAEPVTTAGPESISPKLKE